MGPLADLEQRGLPEGRCARVARGAYRADQGGAAAARIARRCRTQIL